MPSLSTFIAFRPLQPGPRIRRSLSALWLLTLATFSPCLCAQVPATAETSAVALTETERGELIQDLREQYAAWRFAILTRNAEQWEQTTTSHRRHQLRNEIISNGAIWPDSLFQAVQPPPQMTPLRIVDLRFGTDVARLTLFGQLHWDAITTPAPETPHDLMHVTFHRENDRWKVDGIALIALEQRPDWREQFMRLDYGALNGPEFHFSDLKPAPPRLCTAPQHVAMLQIFSSGYRVTAEINGHPYPPIDDGNTQVIVIGGLNDGDNDLKLELEPSTGDAATPDAHVAVNVWVRASTPDQDSSRVFHYMPAPGQVPRQHESTIEVSARSLAEGRR